MGLSQIKQKQTILITSFVVFLVLFLVFDQKELSSNDNQNSMQVQLLYSVYENINEQQYLLCDKQPSDTNKASFRYDLNEHTDFDSEVVKAKRYCKKLGKILACIKGFSYWGNYMWFTFYYYD